MAPGVSVGKTILQGGMPPFWPGNSTILIQPLRRGFSLDITILVTMDYVILFG